MLAIHPYSYIMPMILLLEQLLLDSQRDLLESFSHSVQTSSTMYLILLGNLSLSRSYKTHMAEEDSTASNNTLHHLQEDDDDDAAADDDTEVDSGEWTKKRLKWCRRALKQIEISERTWKNLYNLSCSHGRRRKLGEQVLLLTSNMQIYFQSA